MEVVPETVASNDIETLAKAIADRIEAFDRGEWRAHVPDSEKTEEAAAPLPAAAADGAEPVAADPPRSPEELTADNVLDDLLRWLGRQVRPRPAPLTAVPSLPLTAAQPEKIVAKVSPVVARPAPSEPIGEDPLIHFKRNGLVVTAP
jgi:hypothetical protein